MNRVYWRAVLGLWALSLGACSTPTYDFVISNGHVMDPETGFDRVAHVGIVGSRIEAISDRPLRGNRSIDASGLVVAPGLIECTPTAKTMSGINSTWFAAGWQQTLGISYDKLQWPKTGVPDRSDVQEVSA